MMKKLTLTLVAIISMFGMVASPVYAATDSAKAVCDGIGAAVAGSGCSASTGGPSIDNTIAVVVNILSIIVGLVAVVMIIIGGIKYTTSAGDSNNISSAKNTILYAIVGLVVVALAQVIVRFTLHRVAGPATCPPGQTQIAKPGDCTP